MNIKTKNEIINYILNYTKATKITILYKFLNVKNETELGNLLFPNGQLDIDAADKIAMFLGINAYDLLKCNDDRLNEYLNSYKFFELYKEFEKLKNSENDDRLILFSFPKLPQLISSYNEMCLEYHILFVNAVNNRIEGRDLEKLNFLASVLKAYDISYNCDNILNSATVYNFQTVYLQEFEEYELTDIVEFYLTASLDFWRAVEFVDQPRMVAKLDIFASHWRIHCKTILLKNLKNKNEFYFKNELEVKPLSRTEKTTWLQKFLEVFENAPVYYRWPEERLLYAISEEAEERHVVRDNIRWIDSVPPTFDEIDYIEQECNVGKHWASAFFDAQRDFEHITILDENEDPEDYKEALITYCAGAIGIDYYTTEMMYDKLIEFWEFY